MAQVQVQVQEKLWAPTLKVQDGERSAISCQDGDVYPSYLPPYLPPPLNICITVPSPFRRDGLSLSLAYTPHFCPKTILHLAHWSVLNAGGH